jgi:protein-S-isoprenylcysteine O-methyltransferase Ste14
MTPSTGWALVGLQFGCLAALVVVPGGELWGAGLFARGAALVLITVGVVVGALAALRLGPNLTPSPLPKEDGALITGGLYRWVRHPIYSGLLLVVLGLVMYKASLFHILVGVMLWLVLCIKAIGEEKMLGERFEDYQAYYATTGRFFPRLTFRR